MGLGAVAQRPDVNACGDDTNDQIGKHEGIHRVGDSLARSRLIRRHTRPTMTPAKNTGRVIRPALLGMK
jgi:hypothetical protein